MLKVRVKNSKDQYIQLTQSSSYQLVSITGIDPPVANIATAQLATDDGSDFNIARVPQRNIVLTVQPVGDVEATRTALYPFFTPKSPITVYIKTGNREVKIEGYVESMTCDYNANPQLIQISIICPKPYFKDVLSESQSLSGITTVNNKGDIKLGFTLVTILSSSTSELIISNSTTRESLTFSGLSLQSGDEVHIGTEVGAKTAYYVRGSSAASLLPYLDLTSKWPTLDTGDNSVSVSAGNATIYFTPQYAGL